ncbi:MAG: hypothetical protein KDD25_01210, partial [Bdellovibrionales bacterium]|nr:hypothetical protein [Bdellovibrionales bacterium]
MNLYPKIMIMSLLLTVSSITCVAHEEHSSGADHTLTQADAIARKDAVSDVIYKIELDMTDLDSGKYSGDVKIQFNLVDNFDPESVFLDFSGGEIKSIHMGGQKIQFDYDGSKIRFAQPGRLKPGTNSVEIEFSQEFQPTGDGLHLFKDPADGSRVFYTNLEPYDFSRVAPGFDQPDLKARFGLKLKLPREFESFSNHNPNQVIDQGSSRLWIFEDGLKSQPIPTYIFAFGGGDKLRVFTDTYKEPSTGRAIPLQIIIRNSLAKFLVKDDTYKKLFKGQKLFLGFFQKFFGYDYPFSKHAEF